jgi:hypothetical protein
MRWDQAMTFQYYETTMMELVKGKHKNNEEYETLKRTC